MDLLLLLGLSVSVGAWQGAAAGFSIFFAVLLYSLIRKS